MSLVGFPSPSVSRNITSSSVIKCLSTLFAIFGTEKVTVFPTRQDISQDCFTPRYSNNNLRNIDFFVNCWLISPSLTIPLRMVPTFFYDFYDFLWTAIFMNFPTVRKNVNTIPGIIHRIRNISTTKKKPGVRNVLVFFRKRILLHSITSHKI